MAHFAKLDANNIVEQVIVVNNNDIKDNSGAEVEAIGVAFCQKLLGANTNWKQTSYNSNFRGNYAGIGYTYMTNVATLGVGSTDWDQAGGYKNPYGKGPEAGTLGGARLKLDKMIKNHLHKKPCL